MMTIQEVRERLADRNLAVVAEKSGVNYQTVCGVASGRNGNPSYETMRKLISYLEGSK